MCELPSWGKGEARRFKLRNCTQRVRGANQARRTELFNCKEKCITGKGEPCLYSHMGAAKILAAVAVARAAGVTHIIEVWPPLHECSPPRTYRCFLRERQEGREGGLSAYIYWRLGFNLTSVVSCRATINQPGQLRPFPLAMRAAQEYLPIDEVGSALTEFAPGLHRVDGDGSQLIPKIVSDLGPARWARLEHVDGRPT